MNEWLRIMIEEIRRKKEEHDQDREERRRRSDGAVGRDGADERPRRPDGRRSG